MRFGLPFGPLRLRAPEENVLLVGGRHIRLQLVRNRRAKRYVLRLRRDGAARVTVPRGGSEHEARRFAERHAPWLEKELLRLAHAPKLPKPWPFGAEILFRGEPVRLDSGLNGGRGIIRFGGEEILLTKPVEDLRPIVERHLWRLAARELPGRVFEFAALHRLTVKRVTVRNQRSRWGSCSRRGTISLNWRLVQTPLLVRDYIILHELAHLKEMNHSRRFWNEVERLCPMFAEAERWLKTNGEALIGPG